MRKLLSKYKWFTCQNISVTGFAREGVDFISEERLASWFATANDFGEFERKLLNTNGQFSVIIEHGETIWAATDRLRTIPLFYHKADNEIIISDSAYSLSSALKMPVVDEEAASAFLATGYTLNNLTLIEDLFQVEAGEMVMINHNNITRKFYHDYSKAGVTEDSFENYCVGLEGIIREIFKSYFSALKDCFIAIPLSGGFDSRLIAAMCKEYHPENVLCFTYGRKDNAEVAPAKEVADRLGLPWINIVYDTSLIKGFTDDPVFKDYYPYASELSSMFFMQDYFAVKYLREKNLIPENAVFMPGHSGDFLAGEHVMPFMRRRAGEKKIVRHIINEHFTLIPSGKKEKRLFHKALMVKISPKENARWLICENWDLKERQSKFIVNSGRVFNYFGFRFVMPLWDNTLIQFFNRLPVRYKANKNLYDYVLTNVFLGPRGITLSSELNPTPWQNASQRIKKAIKSILPSGVVSLFISHKSPVLYDELSEYLIAETGKMTFKRPHVASNYNSYLTQWYLLKTRQQFIKH